MKKILIGLGITLLVAIWISGSWVLFNSVALGAEGCGCPAMAGQGHYCNHGGEKWRHHHHFWKMLNLTDEQKKEMFSIRLDERAKMKPLFQSLRTGRKQLIALVTSGKFDEAKAQSIAKGQAAIIADLMVERARMQSRMYALLTPEQRTKIAQIRNKWKARHEKEYEHSN